jgi:hypothetical protein
LEVSTGLFSDQDSVPGEWNGEAYDAILRNYRPDHLALLPGGTGACSWEDGCGVRANQKGELIVNEEKTNKLKDFWANVRKFFTLEESYEDKRHALQQTVDAMDNSNWVHYVKAVYNRFFVYQAQPMNPVVGRTSKLWKQPYSVASNGEVTLSDDPVEVKEEISYKPVNNVDANSKGAHNMADKKKCCPEKVQLLIENEATKFVEDDRAWLEAMDESAVDKLMPEEKSKMQITVENTARDIAEGKLPQQTLVINKDGAAEFKEKVIELKKKDDDPPKTVDEFISNAPGEMKDVLKSAMSMHREKKDCLVASILANKANQFTKEELDIMESKQLEGMAALAVESSKVKDFSLNAGGRHKTEEVEVMEAPKFEDYAKKAN